MKKTINTNDTILNVTSSHSSDKIKLNKSVIIKEVEKYELFDNFCCRDFTDILNEWSHSIETHKYFYHSYECFKHNKSNTTNQAIAKILETNKELILTSIKSAHHRCYWYYHRYKARTLYKINH